MDSGLIWLARWEVILFVGGLALTITFRLFTGGINTKYLLYGVRSDGTKFFSPMRVQLLLSTMAVAVQYLLMASRTTSGQMPRLPDASLEILGLSNVIYLGSKAWAIFKKKLPK